MYFMNSATLSTLLTCTGSHTEAANCRPMSSPAPISLSSLLSPHSSHTSPYVSQPQSSSDTLCSQTLLGDEVLDTPNQEELLSAVVAALVIINVVLVGMLLRAPKSCKGAILNAQSALEKSGRSAEHSACRCR